MFRVSYSPAFPVFEIFEKIKNREELKMMLLTFMFVLGIVLVFVFYIYQRIEVRERVYAINQLQQEQTKLIEKNRKLQLEIASLRSLDRIEDIAQKQLGMGKVKDVRTLRKDMFIGEVQGK